MKILLDHSVPSPLTYSLPGHTVDTAADNGWEELLDETKKCGYELFITADQKMKYQQNFSHRHLAVLVLTNNSWRKIREHTESVKEALDNVSPGQITEVEIR